jgi:hypothetical protein
VVRKIHTPSQLIVVMDSEPFDRDLFRVTLEALGHEGLKQEFLESVSATTVVFEVGAGGEAQGGLGTLWGRTAAGERHITPPMYHAVQTGNVEAGEYFISYPYISVYLFIYITYITIQHTYLYIIYITYIS